MPTTLETLHVSDKGDEEEDDGDEDEKEKEGDGDACVGGCWRGGGRGQRWV